MKVLVFFVLFVSMVNGESFSDLGVRRTLKRTFEAPDVVGSRMFTAPDVNSRLSKLKDSRLSSLRAPDVIVSTRTGSEVMNDVPVLEEWDDEFSDLNRRRIIIGGRDRSTKSESFIQQSEVASLVQDSCRRCMVSGNMACVSRMCSVVNTLVPVDNPNVEHASFVTGVSLHGDILCSLCKQSGDEKCTRKFCEDPERDKHVENSGVECMQGFCRWQKETVVSAGFDNYYNAWWQPNNLMLMFDQFTRDLTSAYREFYVATSRAIDVLG